jgi:hypothetical protein
VGLRHFLAVGKVIYQQTYLNDFSGSRATDALNVVLDASGNAFARHQARQAARRTTSSTPVA